MRNWNATMTDAPNPGHLLGDERRRDAVHVAVAPVTANEPLQPGQRIGLVEPGSVDLAGVCETPIGIVDPFLCEQVETGQRFWLFLFPNSVTGLRHVWTHPAFTVASRKVNATTDANEQRNLTSDARQ